LCRDVPGFRRRQHALSGWGRTVGRVNLASAVVLALAPGLALGAALETAADLDTTAEYDSNAAFLPDDLAEAVWRAVATPKLTLVRGGEESRLALDGALRLQSSSNTAISRNRQDPNVGLTWSREGPRSELSLEGRYEEASTRVTELEDSNLLLVDGTRKQSRASAEWDFYVTDRQTLRASAAYTEASYEDAVLVDFASVDATITYGFRLTERFTPFVVASAAAFEPQGEAPTGQPVPESGLLAAGLGFTYQLTPQWELQVSGSAVTFNTESLPPQPGLPAPAPQEGDDLLEQPDDDWNASFELSYDGPRARLSAVAERTSAPSGIGGFINSEGGRLTWSLDTSEVARVGLQASFRENFGPIENRTYGGGLFYEHDLSQAWTVRASWDYREQQRLNAGEIVNPIGGDAEAHVVALSLNYRGEKP